MSYKEPTWAQRPPSDKEWYLAEIKSGVEVGRHPLSSSSSSGCILLGRAADMVHIPIHHESASRQHARIAFDAQGIPWLRDLQSTHGTTCNKRKLPPPAIGKQESNSHQTGARGVMLFPGDVLQFGASTRIFVVEGPDEYERGAMKAKMQQQKLQQQQKLVQEQEKQLSSQEKPSKPVDDGVSWGLSMDDDVEAEPTNNQASSSSSSSGEKTIPMDMQVPEKHRKALERLNAMKYKLANLETEDGRIRRKGELSDGQEKQLQRNAEREENLKKTIFEQEQELYDKLHPEQAGSSSSRRKKGSDSYPNEQEEEDDDFFDRTKDQGQDDLIGDGESEQSLTAKWKALQQQEHQLRERTLLQAQREVDQIKAKLTKMEASGDEEAFFVQNDLQIAKETLSKVLDEQSKTQDNMSELERLLKIVNPKLMFDQRTGYIGEGPPLSTTIPPPTPQSNVVNIPKDDNTSMSMPPPPPPALLSPPKRPLSMEEAEEPNTNGFAMPPPMSRAPNASSASLVVDNIESNAHSIMPPPPKKKRVVGPSMPPPTSSKTTKPKDETKQQGTLAFLSAMTKQETPAASNDDPPGVATCKQPVITIDPKKDEWRAPEGQDGSGITKLNAKFAGRY